jgi:hypothetical protein
MSIDTAVDGDPGSCRRTARRLHALHGRLDEAGAYLGSHPALARAHFDGRSGDAYRARCAAIGRTVDAAAESCRGLARALNEHADGLDEVLAVMARARELARQELVLHGHTIPTPGGYATDRQRHVFRTVAASVAGARSEESRLRDAWLGALARYAVGPVEDLCLPSVSPTPFPGAPEPMPRAPLVLPPTEGVVSRLDGAAPRTSATVAAPAGAAAAGTSPTVPPDSVWVPWGGGDAA